MKIWTNESVFNHNWESVVKGQFRKYPNPHNTAVMGTDVISRHVDNTGKLHSHRIITSDWALAPWVQKLIGANRDCYAHEYSVVDNQNRTMTMKSINLTFCSFVSMKEQMSYVPHPEDPSNKTLLKQETLVTVQGVPLTSYMESIIVNTVSNNASKGRRAMEWVVSKLADETKEVSGLLDKISNEIQDLKNSVEDHVIRGAKSAIEELRVIHPPLRLQAEQPDDPAAVESR